MDETSGETSGANEQPASGQVFNQSSKKVIQPSESFKAEMAEASAAQSSVTSEASGAATNAESVASETAGASVAPEAPHETPDAVKAFLTSEQTESPPLAPAVTAASGPVPNAGTTAPAASSSAPQPSASAAPAPTASAPPPASASDNLHPVTGQPLVPSEPPKKKRWLIPSLAALAVIIILALLWLFLLYLPNTPNAVYASSLTRTGQAIDQLITKSENAKPTNYQSFALAGSASVNGKDFNLSGNINGNYDQTGNTKTDLNLDIKTEGNTNTHISPSLDLLTAKPKGQQLPDIYFKVSGIKQLLEGLTGDTSLDSLDGQWISVDHQYLASLASADSSQASSQTPAPSKAQVEDAISKVQAVNKQYIFTTNPKSAVLVKKKYIGAEVKYGRKTYHYQMGANKSNLVAYVKALAAALNSSQLNSWSQKTSKQDLVKASDLKSSIASIQKADINDYSFDMWADRGTKLIEAVEFKDPSNVKNSVTLAQTYAGGDTYPFRVDFASDDGKGSTARGSVQFSANSRSQKVNVSFSFESDDNGDKTTGQGNFSLTPSNASVKVTPPTGAEPIDQILQQLGLGSANP